MKLASLLMLPLLTASHAMAESTAAPKVNPLIQFAPLLIIFFIFYFLVIRPQQKRQKLQQDFLKDLKRGDMVITNSGIIGTIKTVSEKLVTLEIDNGVCMKVLRAQILESANALKDAKPA